MRVYERQKPRHHARRDHRSQGKRQKAKGESVAGGIFVIRDRLPRRPTLNATALDTNALNIDARRLVLNFLLRADTVTLKFYVG